MKDTDFEVDMEGAIPKFRTHSPGWNNGYLLPVLSVEAEREFNGLGLCDGGASRYKCSIKN